MAYRIPFSVTVDVHGPRPNSRVSFSLVAIRSLATAAACAAVACFRGAFILPQTNPSRLKPAFFVVVHVEEETDAVRMRTKLRDVRLVVGEITVCQLAEEFAFHLVVPADDRRGVLHLGLLAQPVRHLVVAGAGRDEFLE